MKSLILKVFGLKLFFFTLAAAQTPAPYFPAIPDTLFPCRTYSEVNHGPLLKTAASAATALPDTFELRLNSNTIRFSASNSLYPTGYILQVPCQAIPGTYSVYSPTGQLLNQRRIVIDNPTRHAITATQLQLLTPYANDGNFEEINIPFAGKNAMVGKRYSVMVEGKSLLFGSLPSSGSFVHNVESLAFASGAHTFALQIDSIPNPYQAFGQLNIPFGLPSKIYDLNIQYRVGSPKTCSSLIRLVTRRAPILEKVSPDTITPGSITTLTLTGQHLQYPLSGTFTQLDPSVLKEVTIRKENAFLPASNYPSLGNMSQPILKNNFIYAQFTLGTSLTNGPADLGIIVTGRNDTTYFNNVIHFSSSNPKILDVSPQVGGQGPVLISVITNGFPSINNVFTMKLHKGTTQIVGLTKGFYPAENRMVAELPIGFHHDTGFYDLEITYAQQSLFTKPNAFRVHPPAFKQDLIYFNKDNPPFGTTFSLNLPTIALNFPLIQFSSGSRSQTRICRNENCVLQDSSNLISGTHLVLGNTLRFPGNAEIGFYDVTAQITGLPKVLEARPAIFVHDSTYRPVSASGFTVGSPGAIFQFQVDSLHRWIYPGSCNLSQFRALKFPASARLLKDYAEWKPTTDDVGFHAFELQAPDTCGGKTWFGFIQVNGAPVPVSLKQARKTLPHSLPSARPQIMRQSNGLQVIWSSETPGTLEIFTLNGRILGSQHFHHAGHHSWSVGGMFSTGEMLFMRWRVNQIQAQDERVKNPARVSVHRLRVP